MNEPKWNKLMPTAKKKKKQKQKKTKNNELTELNLFYTKLW